MTNDVTSPTGHPFPPDDPRLSGAEGAHALDDDVDTTIDDGDDADRVSKLPPEEHDADRTVGGGMLDAAGTAIDRGTGTLSGEAQDRDVEADDQNRAAARMRDGDTDDEVAFPTEPGGGTH